MKTIRLVTGNTRKVGEAKLACDIFNIKVKQINLDIDEIQSINPKLIAIQKANSAFLKIKKPLVITDSYWNIPSLKGFPGGYMKDVSKWLSSNDFLILTRNKKDKRVSFTETIVFKDEKRIKIFSNEYWGRIVDPPRGTGNSIENIAEFEGYTLGERRQQGSFSHKPKDYIWYKFAKWYCK